VVEAKVEAALRRLRNRIWLGTALERLSLTLLAGAAAVLALALGRHLLVLPYVSAKAAVVLAVSMTGGGIWALTGRPGIRQAAEVGDRLGLKERLCTYLEYGDRNDPLVRAFREELLGTLALVNPARSYRPAFPGKKLLAALVLLAAAGGILWLPSPRAEEATRREEVNRALQEEVQELAQIRKSLEDKASEAQGPSAALIKQAVALLRELESKLERSYDYRQAALEVAGALQTLRGLGGELDSADAGRLAGVFEGAGQEAAQAAARLRAGDVVGAARALGDWRGSESELRVVWENVRRMLAEGGLKPEEGRILQEMKAVLDRPGFRPEDLAGVLASSVKLSELEEAQTELRSAKERLLARAGREVGEVAHVGGGELGTNNRAVALDGEAAGREAATAAGQFGRRPERKAWALGGGDVPGGGAGEAGLQAGLEKSDAPVFASGSGSPWLKARGQWQEDRGRVEERPSDRVLGLAGEAALRQPLYRDFPAGEAAYLDGYNLPAEKQRLVMGYFRALRGDQTDGAGN
jgi:hypothetical protein